MFDWCKISVAERETGYSEEAIRSKIKKGVWVEGEIWIKAPDGRILISRSGFNNWAESTKESILCLKAVSTSPSPLKTKAAKKLVGVSPPPLA